MSASKLKYLFFIRQPYLTKKITSIVEKTLAIIKPDAVGRNLTGKILERIESNGFRIVAMKRVRLSLEEAQGFYQVHKERPFFKDLTTYMVSGPVVLMVLERENSISGWRELMGAT